jgi:hypothetical protein
MQHWLIRRNGKRSLVYLIAAVLFGVIGLAGLQYGALPLYLLPAIICATQFVYPTPLGWALVFTPVMAGTALWAFALVRDLVWLALGRRPSVLLDLDDSVVFVVLLSVCIAIALVLFRVRPGRYAGKPADAGEEVAQV